MWNRYILACALLATVLLAGCTNNTTNDTNGSDDYVPDDGPEPQVQDDATMLAMEASLGPHGAVERDHRR